MNHDELRKLAEAATPGPWKQKLSDNTGRPMVVEADDHAKIVGAYQWAPGDGATDPAWANTRYIAVADPTTVIGLLDENARLRAAAEDSAKCKACPWCAKGAREALSPTEDAR